MTFAQIRGMQPDDLDFAAACTAAEGWRTQTRAEFEGFYAHDPKGCLIAEAVGVPVGICVGTSYGRYGFVGELIVVPEMRGRDIGRRLLDRAVNHLWQEGARGIYLDAVQAAVPLYWRAGFRGVCCSLRFSGTIEGQTHADVREMRVGDLDAVCALDRAAFGADRSFFLKRRWQRFPALSQVVELDGQLVGYAQATRVDDLLAVGPWVVRPEVERPADLLEAIARAAPGCTLGLGVLERNPAAVQAVRELGLSEREDPPLRMVLGPDKNLSTSPMAYAIGSPAKG